MNLLKLNSVYGLIAASLSFLGLFLTGCNQQSIEAEASENVQGVKSVALKKSAKAPGTKTNAFPFPSPTQRRAAYERCHKFPVKPLDIQEPIELISAEIFADGGTTNVKFRDAKGRKFLVKRPAPWGSKPNEIAYYFGLDGAPQKLKKLAIRGPEEQSLSGVLTRWAKNQPPFWLLLSADRKSWVHWVSFIPNPTYTKPFGNKLYYRNRALLFTIGMLFRQTKPK